MIKYKPADYTVVWANTKKPTKIIHKLKLKKQKVSDLF